MNILGSIFFIILFGYSVLGGFVLFGEYSETRIDPKQKDYKKQHSKVNRIFLTKLIKYTLIVCIPTYFMKDLSDIFGSSFDKKYTLGMLAVPFFLWANTLIMIMVNLSNNEKR